MFFFLAGTVAQIYHHIFSTSQYISISVLIISVSLILTYIIYHLSKDINPIKIFENGIELPKNEIVPRINGKRRFITFSDIDMIKIGNLVTSTIIITNSGERYFIHPQLEKIPIDKLFSMWKGHSN